MWLPENDASSQFSSSSICLLLFPMSVLACKRGEILRRGDLGTNDIIVSDVIRTNEFQVWFLAEHVH